MPDQEDSLPYEEVPFVVFRASLSKYCQQVHDTGDPIAISRGGRWTHVPAARHPVVCMPFPLWERACEVLRKAGSDLAPSDQLIAELGGAAHAAKNFNNEVVRPAEKGQQHTIVKVYGKKEKGDDERPIKWHDVFVPRAFAANPQVIALWRR